MMKTKIAVSATMMLGVLLAACVPAAAPYSQPDTMTPTMMPATLPAVLPQDTPVAPTAKTDSSAAPAVASGAVTINIKNIAFQPATITVKVGTKVTWINLDSAAHTATSDTSLWDSGRLAQNQSFSWVFDKPGAYPYHCTYHKMMLATIVVVP
jgi:plastocyanin